MPASIRLVDSSIVQKLRAGELVVGISRFDFTRRLRRVRVGVHRGRDVFDSGATTQNARAPFHFLSIAAAERFVRRDHATSLVGICALYARLNQRILRR